MVNASMAHAAATRDGKAPNAPSSSAPMPAVATESVCLADVTAALGSLERTAVKSLVLMAAPITVTVMSPHTRANATSGSREMTARSSSAPMLVLTEESATMERVCATMVTSVLIALVTLVR